MERGEQGTTIWDVARDTRRKSAFLMRKPFVEPVEAYALARTFFKAYLKKEYEFTMDELRQELHKVYLSSAVRQRADALIDKLSLLEFTDTKYGQAEVKHLLSEIDGLVKDLVIERQREVPWLTRAANWLFRKRPVQRETVITEYPAREPNDPVSIELNLILERLYIALDGRNVRRAVKEYKQLMRRYDRLGPSMQHRFYHKVHEAYERILRQGE